MEHMPLTEEKFILFSKALEEAADGIQIVDLEGEPIAMVGTIKDIIRYCQSNH